MKRNGAKRLSTVLLCVLFTAILSASVLAAYVPVEIQETQAGNNTATLKYRYKKNGQVTKYTETYSNTVDVRSFTWKKSRLSAMNRDYGNGKTAAYKYTYKKGLLTKIARNNSWAGGITTTYNWKKMNATGQLTYDDGSSTASVTAKRNKKKQLIFTSETSKDGSVTNTMTYYKNGNIKSFSEDCGSYFFVVKYNKKGYLTSLEYREANYFETVEVVYTMNKKKKCPKSAVVTRVVNGKDTITRTFNFTRFKKVKASRNSDAIGNEVPLGINYYIA